MKKFICILLAVLFVSINCAYAVDGTTGTGGAGTCGSWNWGCSDDWDVVLSVPAVKLKQGEDARLFEGIAAGIQLNNMFGKTTGSLASSFIITPAIMLSTSTALDSSTGNSSSEYVLSTAILFGIKKNSASFQIGYSYDLMSSQTRSDFDKTEKGSILFNIGMAL